MPKYTVHALLPVASARWESDFSMVIGKPTPGFTVAAFPSRPRDLFFVVMVSGFTEPATIELFIRKTDGSPSGILPYSIDMEKTPHPAMPVMLRARIGGVVFWDRGIYPVDMLIGGVLVHRLPLLISHNHPENENAYPQL